MGALITAAFAPAVRGDITYTFHLAGAAEDLQVSNSVVAAAALFNQYGSFNKSWDVYYNSGIPTAEANYTGYMGFGSQRTIRTVLHEGSHTLGMGTTTAYANLIASGVWAGDYGRQAELDTYNSYADGLHGDGHAIWPGGMNYETEDGYIERIWSIRIKAAMRCDMGILAYSKEARNELVHPGETAELRVESPVATSYQWYKGGVALTNGGDFSGVTSATLRIANADATDEGSYYCAATGASETLNSRSRQLWVKPAQLLGQWNLNGNATDSASTNHGTAFGSPVYVAGKIGTAIDLDGIDDYVQLPPAAALAKDITVATWVNWDGGNNWQRIFDFGTGTYQYMFLTPKSGSGTLRLAFKDTINGVNAEKLIDTTVLPTGQWVHLAAVLKGNYATLYVNGQAAGSVFNVGIRPTDFVPTLNYIGKSQFADPLFNGRVDDFRVYNYALSGAEVWSLWGQSANQAPVFSQSLITKTNATRSLSYVGQTLSGSATDADANPLTFSKLNGPAWLTVAANGTLSGVPGATDVGTNSFIVRVTDTSGASSEAELQIVVVNPPPNGPVAYWTFADVGAVNGGYLAGNGSRADLNGNGLMDTNDFRIGSTDLSGNGNHLTAWTSSWMKWTSDSYQGDFGMTNGGSFPAAGTDSRYNPGITGIDAEKITPKKWTVEAIFKAAALSGNQTIVGRDGRNVGGPTSSKAALYLSTRGTALAIEYMDVQGGNHNLQVAAGLAVNTWYRVAATSDGTTLRLYRNGSLIGSLNLTSTGTDTSLGQGYGNWSVSRGMFASDGTFSSGHTDRFFGIVDAVAISDVTLVPGKFVTETFGTNDLGFNFNMAYYGIPSATFNGDANSNGIPNGMEYFLGWNPTNTAPASPVLTWSSDLLSVTHPFNPFATGVTGAVEWTTDLSGGNWSSAGVTYATNAALGKMTATLGSATTNQIFVRLEVSH
ncbi:MAG: hypothetical protein RLY20_1666 [Verrucomicrobiota bacterium]